MSCADFFATVNISDFKVRPIVFFIAAAAGVLCYIILNYRKKDNKKVKSIYKKILTKAVPVVMFLLISVTGTLIVNNKTVPASKNFTNDISLAFVDVGQGKSAALKNENNAIVFDCGGNDDAGGNMCEYLNKNGIKNIDYLVLTHLHDDHTNGVEKLCDEYDISEILIPYTEGDPSILVEITMIAEEEGAALTFLKEDEERMFGDVKINFLTKHFDETSSDPNENSIVSIISYNMFKAMITGDITKKAENRLIENYDSNLLSVTVFDVPHHGSKSSSSEDFMNIVRPQISVVSVGNNSYGHPSEGVLSRLLQHGRLLRTDADGTVEIDTDGEKLEVFTGS